MNKTTLPPKGLFLNIKTTAETINILHKHFAPIVQGIESIPILEANNRVLAQDVYSQEDIPNFNRSTMDGYSLNARDTFGASANMPAYLNIAGDVLMGEATSLSLKSGEAARIPTGGMLPENANAVVMIEHTHEIDSKTLEVQKPVGIWENTVRIGQDIKKQGILFAKGRLLRAYEIGALAAIGQTRADVYQRLKVGIISTGDEIVPAHALPNIGQVRDINSFIIGSKLLELGAVPEFYGIVQDKADLIHDAVLACVEQNDVVLICGGSSVGTRDFVVDTLSSMGEVLVHGVAMRPGKPTIVAQIDGKPVIGLPGHPASTTIVFLILVQPLLAHLQNTTLSQGYLSAVTSRNIPSHPGREDYVRVKIKSIQSNAKCMMQDAGLQILNKEFEIATPIFSPDTKYLAEPVFGPSGLIHPIFEANGLIKIPIDCEGLNKGEETRVMLI
ncbi:molybdopterin molybdotransferase MoeA [bacterium]|nr:molybdopterin molybdotransferase MoeA [bacterium]